MTAQTSPDPTAWFVPGQTIYRKLLPNQMVNVRLLCHCSAVSSELNTYFAKKRCRPLAQSIHAGSRFRLVGEQLDAVVQLVEILFRLDGVPDDNITRWRREEATLRGAAAQLLPMDPNLSGSPSRLPPCPAPHSHE